MIPCIIPARGGSKGIRNKNIVPVAGKPLIAWSIEQAFASSLVSEVVVATDCDEIANVARQYGAEVFRRSAASATDDAPSEAVLTEVLLKKRYQHAEAIVFLQATSPIRQPHDIDRAIEALKRDGADSLFSAREIVGYTWQKLETEVLPNYFQREPRQFLKTVRLEENGSIYVFKPGPFLYHGKRLCGKVAVYMMSPLDSFQIDEPHDIPLIESLMEVRLGSHHAAAS